MPIELWYPTFFLVPILSTLLFLYLTGSDLVYMDYCESSGLVVLLVFSCIPVLNILCFGICIFIFIGFCVTSLGDCLENIRDKNIAKRNK